MRREWKTLIGCFAVALVCSQCGQEDKERNGGDGNSNHSQPQVITDKDSGNIPSANVDNQAAVQSEYDALPEAIIEEVPLDDNGEERASEAQFRSYDGGYRPSNGRDAYGYYHQHGRRDDRVQIYRSQGDGRGYGRHDRGYGHNHPDYRHDRGYYNYRPHYRSHLYNQYNWVYGAPYRYRRGNVAIYWYPKPSFRYHDGNCYNFYQPGHRY